MTEESEVLEVKVKSAKNLLEVVVQLHVKVVEVIKERDTRVLKVFQHFCAGAPPFLTWRVTRS